MSSAPLPLVLFLSAALTRPVVSCPRRRFQRAPRVTRPSRGGEERTVVWASLHEELCSEKVVSPHGCAPGVAHIAGSCGMGTSLWSPPWTPVVTLPPVCDGRRVRLLAVLGTCRRLSIGRPGHRPCTRNAWRDVTTTIPATARHSSNAVEPSRRWRLRLSHREAQPWPRLTTPRRSAGLLSAGSRGNLRPSRQSQ
jgi:hypothetical protein